MQGGGGDEGHGVQVDDSDGFVVESVKYQKYCCEILEQMYRRCYFIFDKLYILKPYIGFAQTHHVQAGDLYDEDP